MDLPPGKQHNPSTTSSTTFPPPTSGLSIIAMVGLVLAVFGGCLGAVLITRWLTGESASNQQNNGTKNNQTKRSKSMPILPQFVRRRGDSENSDEEHCLGHNGTQHAGSEELRHSPRRWETMRVEEVEVVVRSPGRVDDVEKQG
jgi:hypothetical protein